MWVMLGHHIVVYGPSCSGKTTIAASIAQAIGVPHIELDAIFWKPDWVESPPEEFRADVSVLLTKYADGWVFDGNYHSRIRDLILPHTDTVVWICLPFRVVFWRALKRTIVRSWTKETLWHNNYESWRLSFFSRESLLLYIITSWRSHFKVTCQVLEEIPHHATIIRLGSSREVSNFLADLSLIEE